MVSKDAAHEQFMSWLRKVKDNSINISNPPPQRNFFASGRLTDSPFQDIFNIPQGFLLRLSSQEDIPEEIYKVPEPEKETIENFWSTLVKEPVLYTQLFAPLQNLRPDPNQLIPQLQFLVKEIRKQVSSQFPESTLVNLETAVHKFHIAPPNLSIEEILEVIKKELPKIQNKEDKSEKDQEDIVSIINSLSTEAKKWLERFLIYLIQNPDVEVDLRNSDS